MSKAFCVNFIGVPNSGKSFWALALTSALKTKGFLVEFIEEYFKDLAFSKDSLPSLADEIIGFGVQLFKEDIRLAKGISVITDSGLPTICFYLRNFCNIQSFIEIAKNRHPKPINILLLPIKNQIHDAGRWKDHTWDIESKFNEFVSFLDEHSFDYIAVEHPTLEIIENAILSNLSGCKE
jgi:nicotinamide riboside kinase